MRHFTKYPSNYISAASETSGAAMRKKKKEIAQKAKEGAKLLATDGDWELYTPTTWEAAVYLTSELGDRAVWDTGYMGDNIYFERYSAKGPIYIMINRNTGEKYQSQPATKSWFYDAKDREKGEQALIDFLDEHPAFAEYFEIEDTDVESCTDVKASYSIPTLNECVPYWQFDKANIVGSFRELVNNIKDNLSKLGFVSKVGTSGFETVSPDTIGVDVDIEINKNADELSADEINLIEGCGAEFGGKNFEL